MISKTNMKRPKSEDQKCVYEGVSLVREENHHEFDYLLRNKNCYYLGYKKKTSSIGNPTRLSRKGIACVYHQSNSLLNQMYRRLQSKQNSDNSEKTD